MNDGTKILIKFFHSRHKTAHGHQPDSPAASRARGKPRHALEPPRRVEKEAQEEDR